MGEMKKLVDDLHQPLTLMAQGEVDYSVESFPIAHNEHGTLLAIGAKEGVIYVTKSQAMAFFGLVDPADFLADVAEAQRVPEIDYIALIERCHKTLGHAQGTRGCIAFARGAEWFRDLVLAAAPPSPAAQQAAEPVTHPECNGLDTPERVRFYEHDFYVLSNFSAFNLRWKGITFPTSEHAYHWEKFDLSPHDDPFQVESLRRYIEQAPSAHEAFKMAERWKRMRRSDWDDVKVRIMRDILRAKAAQHEYVRRKLLATGDRELVEDSWRDSYWGWGPNRDGQNMLGKLWMEVRAELRRASHRSGAEGRVRWHAK